MSSILWHLLYLYISSSMAALWEIAVVEIQNILMVEINLELKEGNKVPIK